MNKLIFNGIRFYYWGNFTFDVCNHNSNYHQLNMTFIDISCQFSFCNGMQRTCIIFFTTKCELLLVFLNVLEDDLTLCVEIRRQRAEESKLISPMLASRHDV